MDYKEYKPTSMLSSLIKLYWTLEVPPEMAGQKQLILPDGCIDMVFILGDDIRRYTSDKNSAIQPRAMVLGQITEAFFVEPTGYVNSFAVRFYPYGFANFISTPIKELADKETPLAILFGRESAYDLEQKIIHADSTQSRIKIVENFLFNKLSNKKSIDNIVKTTIDVMLSDQDNISIKVALKNNISKRRQLERNFSKQIGISPKQLVKVIRFQTALKMMLDSHFSDLTKIAYDSNYYDQAHFIKDFKQFTGTTPKMFFKDKKMRLSSLFYK